MTSDVSSRLPLTRELFSKVKKALSRRQIKRDQFEAERNRDFSTD